MARKKKNVASSSSADAGGGQRGDQAAGGADTAASGSPPAQQPDQQAASASSASPAVLSNGKKSGHGAAGPTSTPAAAADGAGGGKKQPPPPDHPPAAAEEADDEAEDDGVDEDEANGHARPYSELSATQKKNIKKRRAKAQRKAQQEQDAATGGSEQPDGGAAAASSPADGPNKTKANGVVSGMAAYDPLDDEKKDILSALTSKLDESVDLTATKATNEHILQIAPRQRILLEELVCEISDRMNTGVKARRPSSKSSAEDLMAQIDNIRKGSQSVREMTPEDKKTHLEWLHSELEIAKEFEGTKKFQTLLRELKDKVEDRLKANAGAFERAKEWEKNHRLVKKFAALKGVAYEDLPAGVVAKQVMVDLSAEVANALGNAATVARKIGNTYNVEILKPLDRNKPRAVQISGFEEDVTKCTAYLKSLDFSGKQSLTVDAKGAAAIIGRQGANARKLEEEYGVFVHAEKSEVGFYGAKDNVQKACKYIQELLADAQSFDEISVSVGMGKALVGLNGSVVRSIEQATGSQIKVIQPREGGGPPTGGGRGGARGPQQDHDNEGEGHGMLPATGVEKCRVTIRGKADQISAAKKKISEFIKGVVTVEIPSERQVLNKLYSGVGGGTQGGQRRQPGGPRGFDVDNDEGSNFVAGVAEQFAQLRESSGLTILRKDNTIQLIGAKELVDKVKAQITELIKKAMYTSTRVSIQREQMKIWSAESKHKQAVEQESGAILTIARPRPDGSSFITVTGDNEQKAAAQSLINEILDREGHVESMELAENAINALIRNRGTRIQEIETSVSPPVSVSLDKKTKTAKIMGAKDAVAQVKETLQKFQDELEDDIALQTSRDVPIDKDNIGLIIGKAGATIKNIRMTTGVDRIDVVDARGCIALKGRSDCVDKAAKMIEEIVAAEARRRSPGDGGSPAEAHQPPLGGPDTTAASDNASPSTLGRARGAGRGRPDDAGNDQGGALENGPRRGGNQRGGRGGGRPSGGRGRGRGGGEDEDVEIEIQNEQMFPSLGDSLTGGKRARKAAAAPATVDEPTAEEEPQDEQQAADDVADEKADLSAAAPGAAADDEAPAAPSPAPAPAADEEAPANEPTAQDEGEGDPTTPVDAPAAAAAAADGGDDEDGTGGGGGDTSAEPPAAAVAEEAEGQDDT
ncbi:unnamed protein product [Vitrella brassicaformis CCMP3155]|uniref:K Homology domain-containing protein n=1 Tax=Vitrella brassicaformis (strain CCMP3155) TaxID=1169540 RepID=A0A0G4ECM2_VITBC|nr:unnamed protein product [Vitrella brassicaformis CCMP3155]|eukprot:CEL93292.1 unnamed protein product [Vitrella brassicaformis CCMP3155]